MSVNMGRPLGLAAIGALALLAGCGSERDSGQIGGIGRAAFDLIGDAGVRSGVLGARNLEASDAQLRASQVPLIKVTRASLGVGAALSLADEKGPVTIWRSADGKTVTLFNGLLTATRGLGNDLVSASVPSVRAGTSDVLREHHYLGGDEIMRRFAYFCAYTESARAQINLLGVTFDTDLVVETCRGETDSFENRYWFNSAGGILKSVQWVSPETGSLILEFVPRMPGAIAPAINRRPGAAGAVVISGSLE